MNGEVSHSPDFERYKRGLTYYTKNLKNRIYLLYRATLDLAHNDDFTAEELEELAKLAFPGWKGNDDG